MKNETFFLLDLDETPIWDNEIGLFLAYWLQQRANHDDIFGRFARFRRDSIFHC